MSGTCGDKSWGVEKRGRGGREGEGERRQREEKWLPDPFRRETSSPELQWEPNAHRKLLFSLPTHTVLLVSQVRPNSCTYQLYAHLPPSWTMVENKVGEISFVLMQN